ncbi:MAG TPA: hypothetical protein ENN60_01615 [archaeon]|nr:hypothetical protein [archaeon]
MGVSASQVMQRLLILVLLLGLVAYRIGREDAQTDQLLKQGTGNLSSTVTGIPIIGNIIRVMALTDEVYCPYANPYLSRMFSAGGRLELTSGDVMMEPFFAVLSGSITGLGSPLPSSGGHYLNPELLTYKDITSLILEVDEQAMVNFELIAGGVPYTGTLSLQALSQSLNDYDSQSDTFIKFNSQMPMWVCFLVFGLLPFLVVFFFLRDIVGFSTLSRTTKNLIVFFGSLVLIQTGWFSKFVWQLAKIAELTTGAAFFGVIIILSVASVVLSWLGGVARAGAKAQMEAAELGHGLAKKVMDDALFETFAGKKEERLP